MITKSELDGIFLTLKERYEEKIKDSLAKGSPELAYDANMHKAIRECQKEVDSLIKAKEGKQVVIKSPGANTALIFTGPMSIGLFKRKAIGYFFKNCNSPLDCYGGACKCAIRQATLDELTSRGYTREGEVKKDYSWLSTGRYYQVWKNEKGFRLKEIIR